MRVILRPEGNLMGESEREFEQLRAVEEEVRSYVEYFDHHVKAAERRGSKLHPFAPRTVETVERLRPWLERLDEMRKEKEKPS